MCQNDSMNIPITATCTTDYTGYIVLAVNEKFIPGIIKFFLMFDVIKNRGHRPGTEFFRPRSSKRDHGVTCSPLPKVNRQNIKQNVDPDHCTFSDVQYGWRELRQRCSYLRITAKPSLLYCIPYIFD